MGFISSISIQVNLAIQVNVKEKHLTTMKPFLDLTLRKETRYPIHLLCYRGWRKSEETEVKVPPLQLPFKSMPFIGPSIFTILAFIILSACWPLIGGFVPLPWRFHFPGTGNAKILQQTLKQKDLHVLSSTKISYAGKVESIIAMQKCK